jgi:hypothetical protein
MTEGRIVTGIALSRRNLLEAGDVFAGWIGLTPDDEPLLTRDRSVEEIYALDLRFHSRSRDLLGSHWALLNHGYDGVVCLIFAFYSSMLLA